MNEESTQSPKSQDRLQQILLDYVEAAERGAAPERQGFIAAHPEFAEEIVDFLGSYHEFNRLAAQMRVNEDNVPKRRKRNRRCPVSFVAELREFSTNDWRAGTTRRFPLAA